MGERKDRSECRGLDMLGKVCSEKRVVVCGYILNVDLWQVSEVRLAAG